MAKYAKLKCATCGKEKTVAKPDDSLFEVPNCCGKKMYVAS